MTEKREWTRAVFGKNDTAAVGRLLLRERSGWAESQAQLSRVMRCRVSEVAVNGLVTQWFMFNGGLHRVARAQARW